MTFLISVINEINYLRDYVSNLGGSGVWARAVAKALPSRSERMSFIMSFGFLVNATRARRNKRLAVLRLGNGGAA
jgi:hypothetical protein